MELDLNKINKILEEHERRISSLEQSPKNKESESPKIKTSTNSLTDQIIEIRDTGFFSQPKTAEETHNKIKEKYHCELDRVSTALRRIAERKQLRKSSKEIDSKKYKAYTY